MGSPDRFAEESSGCEHALGSMTSSRLIFFWLAVPAVGVPSIAAAAWVSGRHYEGVTDYVPTWEPDLFVGPVHRASGNIGAGTAPLAVGMRTQQARWWPWVEGRLQEPC